MIVSHRHRFIFHKYMRCASTSLEVSLALACGPDDIVTPESDPNLLPQHINRGQNAYGYYNHMSPLMIQAMVGLRTWTDYTTISSVRNPWDRLFSLYHWLEQQDGWEALAPPYNRLDRLGYNYTFKSWLLDLPPGDEDDHFQLDGTPWFQRFIRVEHLAEDYHVVCGELGIQELVGPLDRIQVNRRAGSNYRTAYSGEMRDKVAALYPHTIKTFRYQFTE